MGFNMKDYIEEWHRLNPNYRKEYYQKNKEYIKKWHRTYYKEVISQRNDRDKEIERKRNAELHRKYYWARKKLNGEARKKRSKYCEKINR